MEKLMETNSTHMKPAEVAKFLGVSLRTLSRWHALRIGPARCKVGRTVLYRKNAIEKWLVQNETSPTRKFTND
ncbi:helix-turn-helix domain-containing protein [Ruegeria sp. WL0004]|uniref:Helix-turn-helix domain-containing protein n=1 Tax=Ruegeria marisflavi TaxID=2984152 RepID=A0ABT2WXD0_9RHOB|nr:helix-turn-helix domain-containing protein [Ruegeria sp. WL0004]MCU9840569.1 helix-turn-helix domain-containing protein [Ruegeria sp. WL0004]